MFVSANNGCRDYMETMREWRKLNDLGRVSTFGGASFGWRRRHVTRFEIGVLRQGDVTAGRLQQQCFEGRIIDITEFCCTNLEQPGKNICGTKTFTGQVVGIELPTLSRRSRRCCWGSLCTSVSRIFCETRESQKLPDW